MGDNIKPTSEIDTQGPAADSVENMKDENREKLRRRKKYLRRQSIRRFFTGLLAAAVAVEMAVGIYALHFLEEKLEGIPQMNVKDFISEESSRIYDSRGELLTEIGTYYRENITYNDCPESLVDAFLSVEDSRYFEHNGFDIPRFTKAVIETLTRGNVQGGSTFTMQLVKNTYFSIDAGDESVERDATIEYKLQQIFLSMELEQVISKKEIFELYMNKLNFGDRVRGVEKAAEYYFNKSCRELTLSESALLAGIINLPNGYNPYHYLENATERRNEVLDLMHYHGYIDENELNLAKSIKVEDLLIGEDHLNVERDIYPAYIDAVIAEAQELTGYDPVNKGMQIYTALVPEIQDRIELIDHNESSVTFPDELMQVAIVTMNTQTGEIAGMSGGRNYEGGARLLNRATSGYKQPGSAVKPFLDYALAFEYLGYSIDEILVDRPITFPAESRVLKNFDGEYRGDITIKEAVARSLNIPAILTLQNVTAKIGGEEIVRYLNQLGLSRANNTDYHLSYAIGGNLLETTVKEMAGALGAMVNLGVYNKPHTINRIKMTTGEEYLPEHQDERVLSSGSAYLTGLLMRNNVDSGIFNYMQVLKRSYPVYAKTGTTDWGKDGIPYGIPEGAAKDKWMISATSQYTNAVWIGYDMAVSGEGTYFHTWKSNLNIPGRINNLLLDIEEEVSPDTLDMIEKPDDVESVSIVNGTYPHVRAESWMSGTVNTMISSTGLKNQPLVSYSDYHSGNPELSGFAASVTNGLLYVNWYTLDAGCSGGRDISLHDPWNDIEMDGACLADYSSIYGNPDNHYVVDLYVNDEYYTTVTSTRNYYAGLPVQFYGEVKACGYYSNDRGTSDTICTYAGYFNADEADN